jgi:hypothetical protein
MRQINRQIIVTAYAYAKRQVRFNNIKLIKAITESSSQDVIDYYITKKIAYRNIANNLLNLLN